MKRLLLIFIPIILVFNLSLSAFAADDDDHGDDYNPYEILANAGYLPSSDEDFAEVYKTYMDLDTVNWDYVMYNRYLNKTASFDDFVSDVNRQMVSNGVDPNDFYNGLISQISARTGYTMVKAVPLSFTPNYMPNAHQVTAYNVMSHNKLSYWETGRHEYREVIWTDDISDRVFISSETFDYNRAYNDILRFNESQYYNGYIFSNESMKMYYQNPWSSYLYDDTNQLKYGTLSSGAYFMVACFVYTDDAFSTVPIFKSETAYNQFNSGNIAFYQLEYLKSLKLEDLKNIDYNKLQLSIKSAINNGTWLTGTELQAIINESLLSYLEDMGLDIKSILLAMQSGLFDENGIPYLKDINDKMTIIINNLGNGGSYNDLELQAKLDVIIAMLGLPDVNIDINDPDFDDLKNISLTKFPFSVPTDIMLLVSLIGVEPEKPELEIGFPLMGSDELYTTTVNLDWFDAVQPYWFAFCDIGYCIFLLMLSLKIIEGVKD